MNYGVAGFMTEDYESTISKLKTQLRCRVQPIKDNRFVPNKIVEFLLDNGGYDMNKLASMCFSDDDRAQFAMLIGYSLGGFRSLSYVSDEIYYAAVESTNNRSMFIPDGFYWHGHEEVVKVVDNMVVQGGESKGKPVEDLKYGLVKVSEG